MDILANAIHFIFKKLEILLFQQFRFSFTMHGFFFLAAQPVGSPKSGGDNRGESIDLSRYW